LSSGAPIVIKRAEHVRVEKHDMVAAHAWRAELVLPAIEAHVAAIPDVGLHLRAAGRLNLLDNALGYDAQNTGRASGCGSRYLPRNALLSRRS